MNKTYRITFTAGDTLVYANATPYQWGLVGWDDPCAKSWHPWHTIEEVYESSRPYTLDEEDTEPGGHRDP